jgi:hypothetical protein
LILEFNNVNTHMDAFKIVNKKCKSELKYQLLTLIFNASNTGDSYEEIFTNPIWFLFIKYYYLHQFNKDSTQKNSEIILKIAPVVSNLWHFMCNLKNLTCSISNLKLVVENKENLLKMLNILDSPGTIGINEKDWKNWEFLISDHSNLTQSLHTFLTFYCGELLVNYEEYLHHLNIFKQKEKSMNYMEMQKLLSQEIPLPKNILIWLYENRKSKFFLFIWRKSFSSL